MKASDTKKPSKTDWVRLEEMTDETTDTSDISELGDDFFGRATWRLPQPVSVAIEIDPDVLIWFKAQDNSAELMKAALRIYAEAHRKAL